MPSARRRPRAGSPGTCWRIPRSPRISVYWGDRRSKTIVDRMHPALSQTEKQASADSTGLFIACSGALGHPEELTDRCCLSALAGLSKYLPSLSAVGHYRCDAVLCQVLITKIILS